MHMQAPTLTTTRRPPLFVVVGALAVAAIVALVLALATNDDSSTSSVAPVQPAVAQSDQDRVLDGSPLLRAGAAAPAVTISAQSGVNRVWDGTPALRTSNVAHPHSGGGPQRLPAVTSSLAGSTDAQPQAQFPVRPPEGFHRQP
jgi:hypothetical protein